MGMRMGSRRSYSPKETFMGNSPWGGIQHSNVIAPGCKEVGTAGHGGVMVTIAFAEKHLSEAARKRAWDWGTGTDRRLCYEEDCQAAIPLWELINKPNTRFYENAYRNHTGNLTFEERKQSLLVSLSGWNADYLLEIGVTPDPEAYARWKAMRDEEKMRVEKHPDLIISASGDWHDDCKEGEVRVTTADGNVHFVTQSSYRHNPGGKLLNLLSHCDLTREG